MGLVLTSDLRICPDSSQKVQGSVYVLSRSELDIDNAAEGGFEVRAGLAGS
jgi:hypothetical protein